MIVLSRRIVDRNIYLTPAKFLRFYWVTFQEQLFYSFINLAKCVQRVQKTWCLVIFDFQDVKCNNEKRICMKIHVSESLNEEQAVTSSLFATFQDAMKSTILIKGAVFFLAFLAC